MSHLPVAPARSPSGETVMPDSYGTDIYTEAIGDPDTLPNLGPLRPMAGTWEGAKGLISTPWSRHRARRVHGALRPPTHRFSDERPTAVLRAALPHPYSQADRSGDVP